MTPRAGLPTILLVEDNIDDRDAALRSFKAAHLDNPVHWCKTGQEALDYLTREGAYAQEPGVVKPALILLDLNMPGVDGRKVLASIKQDPALRTIPIIILTTSIDEGDMLQCYALGASTYIEKPMDFDRLIEAIGRIEDCWFRVALLPGR